MDDKKLSIAALSPTLPDRLILQFQNHRISVSTKPAAAHSIVSALRLFVLQTIDRPDLARKLVRMKRIHELPVVMSPNEVARLLGGQVSEAPGRAAGRLWRHACARASSMPSRCDVDSRTKNLGRGAKNFLNVFV